MIIKLIFIFNKIDDLLQAFSLQNEHDTEASG